MSRARKINKPVLHSANFTRFSFTLKEIRFPEGACGEKIAGFHHCAALQAPERFSKWCTEVPSPARSGQCEFYEVLIHSKINITTGGSAPPAVLYSLGVPSSSPQPQFHILNQIPTRAIGTLATANFTWSADRPVGCVGRSEPLRISLVG